MPTPEIKQQMLTSPLLADKPLLYTTGQTVFHKDLGLCEVLLALGARKRQISYRYFNAHQEVETKTMWVDVADLSDAELSIQRDLADQAHPVQLDPAPESGAILPSFQAEDRQS
jgi:hypothetical protein